MPYLGRAPAAIGTIANVIEGDLKVKGTISGESINDKFAFDTAADLNDHFLIEAGGTDGSGTNAGDNMLLEDTTQGLAESVELSAITDRAGTSGQVLQSQGAGLTPTFATAAPGGHLTRISSTDISGAANYTFTAVDSSSYDGYAFHVINLVPVTDDVKLYGQTSTDGGSNYDSGSSDYRWCVNERDSVNTGAAYISFMENHADAGYSVGSAAGETGVCGWIYVHSPQTTAVFTMMTAILGFVGDDGIGQGTSLVTGIRASAADVDAWKFYYSSGNIETGTITAYGINNA